MQVELPDDSLVTYTYNARLQCVERDDGIDETSYLWDARNIVLETVNSTPETVYTLAPEEYGNLISQRQASASYFFHYDAQGSTANLTDSTATEENAYTYDAWGTIEAQSGAVDNPFTYVGRQGYYRDEATARYLVRRRQYEAGIGRFLSADPEGFEAGDDNLYRYVGNDPANGVDPSGWVRSPTDLLPTWRILFMALHHHRHRFQINCRTTSLWRHTSIHRQVCLAHFIQWTNRAETVVQTRQRWWRNLISREVIELAVLKARLNDTSQNRIMHPFRITHSITNLCLHSYDCKLFLPECHSCRHLTNYL